MGPRRRLALVATQLGSTYPIPAASSDAPPLFTASVPMFLRTIGLLRSIVSRVGGRERLLHAKLAPDMMSAATQMHVAVNYALRITFPLAGKPVPDQLGGSGPDSVYQLPALAEFSSTDVGDIMARIDAVVAALESLSPKDFVSLQASNHPNNI